MTCEGPSQLRRGEQVGIRCGLFNKWTQYVEVMVTLHGNENYRFINVEEYGIVSSYSPRLTAGDVQVMVSVSICQGIIYSMKLFIPHFEH